MNKARRLATISICAAAAWVLSSAPSAQAHFLGKDAVDGNEIRWSDTTKYDDARTYAINTWNGLNPINILKDTASTINDLRFNNFNSGNVAYDGRYLNQAGEDVIDLNDYFVDGYSDTKKRGVMAHELGHALGLGHSSGPTATCPCYPNNLMVDNTPGRGSITTPQSHDKTDYHALWG